MTKRHLCQPFSSYSTKAGKTSRICHFPTSIPVADISCDSEMCQNATWSDPSWRGGHVPGIVRRGAPLKDTVTVPAGGYVVLRFLADNPGALNLPTPLDDRHASPHQNLPCMSIHKKEARPQSLNCENEDTLEGTKGEGAWASLNPHKVHCPPLLQARVICFTFPMLRCFL